MAKAKMSYLIMADRWKLRFARKPSDATKVVLEVIERIPESFFWWSDRLLRGEIPKRI